MSKVFLCGDPHGEFDHILSAIDQWHPDAVLILGDLTPSHSLDEIFKGVKGTKIYWIPGNHDTDSDLIYDRLWRSSFAKHNLHGRVQDVGRRIPRPNLDASCNAALCFSKSFHPKDR